VFPVFIVVVVVVAIAIVVMLVLLVSVLDVDPWRGRLPHPAAQRRARSNRKENGTPTDMDTMKVSHADLFGRAQATTVPTKRTSTATYSRSGCEGPFTDDCFGPLGQLSLRNRADCRPETTSSRAG
jgi:hypothetical protein